MGRGVGVRVGLGAGVGFGVAVGLGIGVTVGANAGTSIFTRPVAPPMVILNRWVPNGANGGTVTLARILPPESVLAAFLNADTPAMVMPSIAENGGNPVPVNKITRPVMLTETTGDTKGIVVVGDGIGVIVGNGALVG